MELAIVILTSHRQPEKYPFTKGLYRTLKVPGELVGSLVRKGFPLMLNEALWSGGQTVMTQLYSRRGLAVVAALNISNTVSNLFFIAFIALGNAVGIVIGGLLGADKLEEARETNTRMTAFSVVICAVLGLILLCTAGLFPMLYNTTEEVRSIAASFLRLTAVCMPIYAFSNACYFTLRSGGLVKLTMLFDCGFVWLISIPLTYSLSVFTGLPIVPIFAIVQASELIKVLLGYTFVRQGKWLRNIVDN